MWLLCKIVDTIVVNNVYRKIGELLIIILKVLALDLPDSVKKPHLGPERDISLCKFKPKFLVLTSKYTFYEGTYMIQR